MKRDEAITFDDIIAPLSRERFLSEYWNKSFLHLTGPKGRFTSLLTCGRAEQYSGMAQSAASGTEILLHQTFFRRGRMVDGIGVNISTGRGRGGETQRRWSDRQSFKRCVPDHGSRCSGWRRASRALAEALQEMFQGLTVANLKPGGARKALSPCTGIPRKSSSCKLSRALQALAGIWPDASSCLARRRYREGADAHRATGFRRRPGRWRYALFATWLVACGKSPGRTQPSFELGH